MPFKACVELIVEEGQVANYMECFKDDCFGGLGRDISKWNGNYLNFDVVQTRNDGSSAMQIHFFSMTKQNLIEQVEYVAKIFNGKIIYKNY